MESYITQKCILYCIISELYEKRWVNFCLTRVESGEEKIGKLVHLGRDSRYLTSALQAATLFEADFEYRPQIGRRDINTGRI